MVGFIEPVGTSFQSASADRSELTTSSMARKTRISLRTFFFMDYRRNKANQFVIALNSAQMSHRSAVHDLKTLVLSFHSLQTVETVEEERVRSLLIEVSNDLRLPFFEWSVTEGLRRLRGATMDMTQDALQALRAIEKHDFDAVYLFKDLAPHLSNANIARALRDLAHKLTSTRSAIVLTGQPIELPPDIDALAVRFELNLPDEDELREVIRAVIDSISARQPVRVELTREDAQRIVRALSGLTLNQARQVIAQAVVDDGCLSANDIQTIIRRKGELLEHGGVLEFFPVDGNRFDVGGGVVDRRDRESLCSRGQRRGGWRIDAPPLRLVSHLAPGKGCRRIRRWRGERSDARAAGTAAQGPIRRNFLRRPSDARRAPENLSHSPEA